MSQLTVGIRLTADGSGLVGEVRVTKAELDKLKASVGDVGGASKRASNEIDSLGNNTRQAAKEAREMDSVASKVAVSMRAWGAAAGAAVAALGAAAIRGSVAAAIEAEQAQTKLAAVLRATGHAAGLTAGEINNMADSMAATTVFDDEAIRNASAVMLTFRNISGRTFSEAIRLSADLSAVLGGDLQSSVMQIGKALNDPAEGVSALSRAGITFSDVQKDMIKGFVEANDLASAQAIVLAELEKQVGGVAQSMNTGLTKSTNDLKKAWDEMLESLGNSLPFETVMGWMTDAANSIRGFVNDPSLRNTAAAINPFVPIVDRSQKPGGPAGSGLIDRGNLPPGVAGLDRDKAQALLGKTAAEETRRREAEAQKRQAAQEEAKKRADILKQQAGQLTQSVRTPDEVFADELSRYQGFLAKKLISGETYNRAVLQQMDAYLKTTTEKSQETAQQYGERMATLARLAYPEATQSAEEYGRAQASVAEQFLASQETAQQYGERMADLARIAYPEATQSAEEYGQRMAEESRKWLAENKTFAQEWSDTWSNAAAGFTTAIGRSVADAILEQKKFSDLLRISVRSMAREVIASLVSIAVQRAAMWAAEKAGLIGNAAIATTAAATSAAAWAPAAAGSSLATLGANAIPAAAGMTATYSLAQGLAAAGVMGMAHDGLDSVPRTGTFLLERGERVIKKEDNKRLEKFLDGERPTGALNITFNINGDSAPRASEIIDSQKRRIIAILQSAYDDRGKRGGPLS